MEQNKEKLNFDQKVAIYLHQDNLMWNLLQTIGIVQIASLSAAYAARPKVWLSIIILTLGFFLMTLVFFIFKRTELQRDKVMGESRPNLSVARMWYAPLRGSEIAAILVGLLSITDIAMGIALSINLFS
jgi:hypothetical protein